MTWLIDEIIAFLTSLRSDPLISQVLTLAGIPGIVAFAWGVSAWMTTRRARAAVAAYDGLDARLTVAQKEAGKLRAEVDRLAAETPDAFLAAHGIEMRDQNDERAMALAESFVERQRDALMLAFRTRMDEAVRQSVEDGAPAFNAARRWALAALALEPTDRTLRMMVDELAEAEAIAASGARVKLKGDEDRKARAVREDRLPTDSEALTQAFLKARDQCHYALMLFLADHGLMLTRRSPFGAGSQEHLIYRRHRVEALSYAGRSRDALAEAEPLVEEFVRLFGNRVPATFYTRSLLAECRKDTGDAATALTEIEELLPLYTEVQGARHPDVLATRSLLAECRKDTGDAATALTEIEELLPLYTEVLGARHPSVLATRSLLAAFRKDTGDAATALTEIEELLPLRTEVQGARHPDVLATRSLLAECRKDTGDAATALTEIEELLPLYTEVLGARHPSVLATRSLLAACRKDTGDAATALTEIEELLPLYTEVLGARNPSMLATRFLLAACRKDTGDAATALTEIEELLPLYTEVLGARNPSVLAMRTLRATCLLHENDRERAEAEIESVRAGLLAAKLRPEHRFFRWLEEVENRLQPAERQTDGTRP